MYQDSPYNCQYSPNKSSIAFSPSFVKAEAKEVTEALNIPRIWTQRLMIKFAQNGYTH